MRITGVRLQNIACFEDLSLDFTNEDTGEAAPWIVILGDNGTGKSTLLQVMSAGFLGARLSRVAASDVDFIHYVRDVELGKRHWAEGHVRMDICCDEEDLDEPTFPNDAVTEWPFSLQGTINLDRKANLNIHVVAGNHPVHRLHGDDLDGGWFACGYGSARRLTGQPTTDRGSLPTVVDSAKPYRFASILGDSSGMTNIPDWIAGLYFSSIYPGHTDFDVKRYEIARDALLRALPHISSLHITKDRRVMVTEGDTTVPLDRLSDGYRGTLAWIGDLIRRLFDAYPDSDDPLKESGVVLVDEIDLHLHPKWQRSVVEDVRKLFPNLQFIVTSHSPFVAQDMRPEDKIIVLERSGRDGKGPVVAREENGSLEDWER